MELVRCPQCLGAKLQKQLKQLFLDLTGDWFYVLVTTKIKAVYLS